MANLTCLKMFSCDEDELDVMYEEWKNCTDEYKEVKVLFIFYEI